MSGVCLNPGDGDYTPKFDVFDVYCLPYKEGWASLYKRSEVSKLASEFLNIGVVKANKLFDGEFDKDFCRNDRLASQAGGDYLILIAKNVSKDISDTIQIKFSNLGIRSSIIGKSIQDARDEKISNLINETFKENK